jgi:predicted XRE-type DNA-binding protein
MNKNENGAHHVTLAGRSVFLDLFPPDEAEELAMRAVLLNGLKTWLDKSELTQTAVADVLHITQARASDIKRGKINQFSLDFLVRIASRAGLHPRLELQVADTA